MLLFYKNKQTTKGFPFLKEKSLIKNQTSRANIIYFCSDRRIVKKLLIPFYFLKKNKSTYLVLLRFLVCGSVKRFMEEFEKYYLKKNPHLVFLPSKKNTLVVKICLHMNIPFYLIAAQKKLQTQNILNYFEILSRGTIKRLQ